MKNFSIERLYKRAFRVMGDHLKIMLIIIIVNGIISYFMGHFIDQMLAKNYAVVLPFLFLWLLQSFFHLSVDRISLDLFDRGDTDWDMSYGFRIWGTYLLSSLMYIFIVLGGLVLLIVPGIIWLITYYFSTLLVIDTQCPASESISRSGELTEGHKSKLFIFFIINEAASRLLLLIGWGDWFSPIFMFARVSAYRQLKGKK